MLNLDFLDRVVTPDRVRPGSTIETDVLVIGTGAGGAVVARELAEAGVDVVILEEGGYHTGRDYGHLTAVEAVKMLYRSGGFTTTAGNSSVLLPNGRCVGGSTVINSGTALRAVPETIQRWRGEYGLDELTAAVDGYFERVERFLHVKPVPKGTFGRNNEIFRTGAERTEHHGAVLTRNEHGCRGAGRCFLGCPNDAKQAMNVSYVPRALRNGAKLYVNCKAKRILVEGGRAVGVEAVAKPPKGQGDPFVVTFRARTVICAAGAIYTPLLLRSVPGRKGRGLGRHLKIHPATRVVGHFDEAVRAWEGVLQGYHLESTLTEGISVETIFLPPSLMGPQLPYFGETHRTMMEQYDHLSMLGVRVIEDTEGRVIPSILGFPGSWPIIFYWLKRVDVLRMVKGVAISAEIQFAAGARKVYTGIRGHETLRSMADVGALLAARVSASEIELSGYHSQGTAKMAATPERGVVDPTGQVWGVADLYVADASLLPITPVMNPQVSIMAFATHVAASLLSRRGLKLVPQDEEVLSQSS